jgi:Fe-S-cluster-containing dehydrogenase component
MPRYGIVIDQRRCVACMACVIACKKENDVPPGQFRTRVEEKVEGEFPSLRMELRSELCNHCDNPPCVYNCPPQEIPVRRLQIMPGSLPV